MYIFFCLFIENRLLTHISSLLIPFPPLLSLSLSSSSLPDPFFLFLSQKRTGFQKTTTKHDKIKCNKTEPKASHCGWTRQTNGRKRAPKEGTRVTDPFLHTLRSPTKALSLMQIFTSPGMGDSGSMSPLEPKTFN